MWIVEYYAEPWLEAGPMRSGRLLRTPAAGSAGASVNSQVVEATTGPAILAV